MTPDRGEHIVLNMDMCKHFSEKNDIATLWHYAICIYLTRGLGWSNKENLIKEASDLTGLSVSAIRKWFPRLQPLVVKDKKNVMVLSKAKAEVLLLGERGSKSMLVVQKDDLTSYTKFKKLLIVQLGLTLQRRFTYAWDELSKRPRSSPETSAWIDHPIDIPQHKKDVGASLSKISQFSGIPESTVHRYTKDVSERKYNVMDYIHYRDFKKRYSKDFFILNPTYSFIYMDSITILKEPWLNIVGISPRKGFILILKAISSRINSPNLSKKRNHRNA